MYDPLVHSDFKAWLEQLRPGQTQKIPTQPHPVLIACLLHTTYKGGPHILVSTQEELLTKIREALFFLEPEQKVFSLREPLSPYHEQLNFSYQSEYHRLQLMAQAQRASKEDIFMVHPQSLFQRTVCPLMLKKKLIQLKKAEMLPSDFSTILTNMGYRSQDRVEQMGDFSMRGAVLDIFCPLSGPLRIDLIGNLIAQIKSFNVKTQISSLEIKEVQIPPARQWSVYDKKEIYKKTREIIKSRREKENQFISFREWNHFLFQDTYAPYTTSDILSAQTQQEKFSTTKKNTYDFLRIWKSPFLYQSTSTILDHFQNNSPLIWNLDEPDFLNKTLQLWKEEIQKNFEENKQNLYPSFDDMYLSSWKTEKTREIIFDPFYDSQHFHFLSHTVPPTSFFKNQYWPSQIKKQREKGRMVFISTGKEKTRNELTLKLESEGIQVKKESSWLQMKETQYTHPDAVHLIQSFTCENLIWPHGNLVFLKADVFSSSSFRQKKIFFAEKSKALSAHFAELQPRDLVVHRQYGIGQFEKLELLHFGANRSEFLILKYRDGDRLYVPIYALHQVHKYSSPTLPANKNLLDKLGDKRWLNTKEKVKKRIRDMTMELVNLYSLRSSLKRKEFSEPGEDFEKFEEEFSFQETPDQKKAIEQVLQDLTQKEQPADRLICGDTGFGKTEVALRAAFKVIENGFQVCLMAPTTILSFQHFERFKERFKNWPVKVCLLNRFTSLQKKKQILKETKEGKVDILIGTHRILSRDIHFKSPGLLIIDEEHLFGVKSKEKIKNWYSKVDTISLSATPIPRSLSMSLSGLRDMSIILTPPLNRKAVKTFISPFREKLIKEAVLKELDRKGQIIFIHNRVSSIYEVEKKLQALFPSVRIQTAHGQMKDLQQKVVLDFFQHKFDLLLCTTIVESGMDFPRASTLFINQAEQFGLSQLHQLRGRIGRSERQSYCYLLTDPNKKISSQALERLKIIQENNQPGSGITIAQYDLEMRGAGELMGQEQSGFLQEVGYEMYFEFLQENISRLKNKEIISVPEPDLQFKQAAFIPKKYIPHEKARLVFYKRLAMASSEKAVEQIKTEIEDFAGPLPEETKNLILLSHCRPLARQLHIRELSCHPPWLYINLADSTPLSIPQILKWIEEGLCEWQDKNTLRFSLEKEDISAVWNLLKKLLNPILKKTPKNNS